MEERSKSSLRRPFHRPLDLGMIFIRSLGTLVFSSSSVLRALTPAVASKVIWCISLPHLTVASTFVMIVELCLCACACACAFLVLVLLRQDFV